MRLARLLLLAPLALLFAAGRSSTDRIRRVENGLAERMAHQKVPGVSIAVIDKYEIVWAKGYGVLDTQSNKPVDTQTLFQAASISKPVTASVALHLVESGQLSLDVDVNQFLKAWKVPEDEFTNTEKVTLRRILSHSAGLTVHGFPGYAAGARLPTLIDILDGKAPANTAAIRVDTVPGAIERYSAGGYPILQMMLTEVSGKPFPRSCAKPCWVRWVCRAAITRSHCPPLGPRMPPPAMPPMAFQWKARGTPTPNSPPPAFGPRPLTSPASASRSKSPKRAAPTMCSPPP